MNDSSVHCEDIAYGHTLADKFGGDSYERFFGSLRGRAIRGRLRRRAFAGGRSVRWQSAHPHLYLPLLQLLAHLVYLVLAILTVELIDLLYLTQRIECLMAERSKSAETEWG